MEKVRSLVTGVPELTFLILLAIIGYILAGVFSQVEGTPTLSSQTIWLIVFGSFIVSTAIAILAPIVGVGGGVIFTPLMMGFTDIDPTIISATGLVVAMFSGLVSSGPFFRKGLSDIKIISFAAVPIVIGGMSGSIGHIFLREILGPTFPAILRLTLGLIILFIAYLFITGGAKTEYPKAKRIDGFSKKLGLNSVYWEESLGKRIEYHLTRSHIGAILLLLVGFTGGFFGLGGGWAVVPVLNIVTAAPLKVSAACSGVLLALGNSAAIWPYIMIGAIIPVFAGPWMVGQVVGGTIGAHILVRVRAAIVRYILIAILVITAIKLIGKGIGALTGIEIPIIT